ncbi:M20 family metallopeptidase [Mycetocola reblochoni]|uniref:Peptidase M20 domain-containing protein 2 n=2 Tax=Mycetocola reblochoni TaxID=331618 RepID=A0A1R4K9Z4_9MICO|nr:M20 family metallopeptidase [Mycetocola reblochoni]RLP71193.1 M20 family peptidase [Mycetocola reblochoni]SJN41231.1 Catalyzes the cleavage of p-aminobenzoyl-glutamate to p-aminobenzoate and glutamate, subunit A [Mycetocola reblochoni REB411]
MSDAAAPPADGSQRDRLLAAARDAVAANEDRVVALSRALHAEPETAWQEHRAVEAITAVLSSAGFSVERGTAELETAFVASTGHGERTVALVAEYDALPGLGHACGHNLIAASAVGAALALAPLADELGLTVRVYGTPAEEGGGGKILMLDAGVFDDVDAALMVHPGPNDSGYARPRAVAHVDVEYTGAEAHAAAYPERGVNAADAALIAQVAIGLLRQQLPDGVRVHGIVREAGTAPNAIPGRARASWYVRASTLAELDALFPRVTACFEAGALATGCTVRITETSGRYSEFRNDEALLADFAAHAAALGRDMDLAERHAGGMNTASTDMGNVSLRVRAIHPYLSIGTSTASNHQAAFAEAAGTPEAERAALDGAVALAQTVIDDAVRAASGTVPAAPTSTTLEPRTPAQTTTPTPDPASTPRSTP